MAGEFVESLRILLPFCCFVSSVLSSSNVILPVNGRSHRRSPWHPSGRAHPEGSRLGGSEWVPHPAAKGWVVGRYRTASPISTTRTMPFSLLYFPSLPRWLGSRFPRAIVKRLTVRSYRYRRTDTPACHVLHREYFLSRSVRRSQITYKFIPGAD